MKIENKAQKSQIDNNLRFGDEMLFTSEIYERGRRRGPFVCSIQCREEYPRRNKYTMKIKQA